MAAKHQHLRGKRRTADAGRRSAGSRRVKNRSPLTIVVVYGASDAIDCHCSPVADRLGNPTHYLYRNLGTGVSDQVTENTRLFLKTSVHTAPVVQSDTPLVPNPFSRSSTMLRFFQTDSKYSIGTMFNVLLFVELKIFNIRIDFMVNLVYL